MLSRTKAIAPVIGVSALLASFFVSLGSEPFDLSPEQSARPRAGKDPALVVSIPQTFKFVEDGALTVAIALGGAPPIATYAPPRHSLPDIAHVRRTKRRTLTIRLFNQQDSAVGLRQARRGVSIVSTSILSAIDAPTRCASEAADVVGAAGQ
ncbi:hypothetical protein ASE05_30580 [Mesorhizobium sp. Root172]|jgi:polar amino acid transport system substrate-binding protein|nr:hypothetical protein ASE05_30580 [Mesorhizobium sp. Root172]